MKEKLRKNLKAKGPQIGRQTKMTTSFNREKIKQMLDDSGIDYSLNSDTPGIVYEDGAHQTFDQALENFRQQFIYPERNDS